MLKPRYNTFRESLEDFRAMCEDMDRTQPTEEGLYRELDEQRAERAEQHRLMQEEVEWQQIAEEQRAMEPVMADPAPLSQYGSSESAMRSMRVLAGLEEQEFLPRDPGMHGSTRFNDAIMEQATPWDDVDERGDELTEAAKKKEFLGLSFTFGKDTPQEKLKRATKGKKWKGLPGASGKTEDEEYDEEKWAADAVKRPGRLHRYFGIPEGEKIPMGKIKKEYNRLKDKENKSAAEVSLLRALALGVRFKGGDVPGGEKKKGLKGEGTEYEEGAPSRRRKEYRFIKRFGRASTFHGSPDPKDSAAAAEDEYRISHPKEKKRIKQHLRFYAKKGSPHFPSGT